MSKNRIIHRNNEISINSTKMNYIVEIALNGVQNRNYVIKSNEILRYERRVTIKDFGECFMGIYLYPENSDVGQKDNLLYLIR